MPNPPALRGCRIHAVGDGWRRDPWSKPARRLPCHLLVLSLDGRETVRFDDHSHAIVPGEAYLIAAGQRTAIGSPTGNRPLFIHCDLVVDGRADERAAWQWYDDPDGLRIDHWQPSPSTVLQADIGLRPPESVAVLLRLHLPTIIALWRQGEQLAMAEAENQLEGLFLAWARASTARPATDDTERRIARAEAVALQHLDTPFGVRAFANAAGLRRSRFHQVYLQLRGEAPGAFLRRTRIAVAETILRGGGDPAAAAQAAGFADRAAFSRAFAHHNGLPPARWARLHANGSRGNGPRGIKP